MSIPIYRQLDDVPTMPEGLSLYRADMTSGIPDDDGAPSRFDRWCFASSSQEAIAAFETWAEDVHEGIVINDVEKEETEDAEAPEIVALTLTAAEINQAAWALDPMADHASDDLEEGKYPPAAVPRLINDVLSFPTANRAVALDMLYRLEVQLVEMAQAESQRHPPSAKSLAKKIRTAFAVTEDESRAITRGEV